ncbi:glycosyl hydrolase family 28-related protein [Bacillus taeanensis]|nr:glycosyl hydrolase family 28-related protein [Bacillus taeanensis]
MKFLLISIIFLSNSWFTDTFNAQEYHIFKGFYHRLEVNIDKVHNSSFNLIEIIEQEDHFPNLNFAVLKDFFTSFIDRFKGDSRQEQKEKYKANVLEYGADPDGVKDSTQAIQKAIYSLPEGGELYFPAGTYLVSSIHIDKPLSIIGVHVGQDTSSKGGTIIKALKSSSKPLIVIRNKKDNKFINGFSISNLLLEGDGLDKSGIEFYQVGWDAQIENLNIQNFKRQAIIMKDLMDVVWTGGRIKNSGTDGKYAAIELNSASNVTNAIHVFGLHVENCEFMLKANAGRQIQFVASKFELNNKYPKQSPIQITSEVKEILFTGSQFHYADTSKWGEAENQPHMIKIENRWTNIKDCTFTSRTQIGAKFIHQTQGSGLLLEGNQFHWLSADDYSIVLNENSAFTGNKMMIEVGNRKLYAVKMGSGNKINDNILELNGIGTNNGQVFYSGGTNNEVKANRLIGTASHNIVEFFALDYDNNVFESYNAYKPQVLKKGKSHPSTAGKYVFKATDISTQVIMDFNHAHNGKTITIMAENDGVMIQNNDNIKLKSGKDRKLKQNEVLRLTRIDSVWYEN